MSDFIQKASQIKEGDRIEVYYLQPHYQPPYYRPRLEYEADVLERAGKNILVDRDGMTSWLYFGQTYSFKFAPPKAPE